jgi:dUTP pyrophosphatase
VRLEVKRLDPGLPLPRYQHPGDAGLDLHSAEDVVLEPGRRAVIGTGIAVAIPEGYVGLTAPRSGLAARSGLTEANSPGVVDSGYRGEIKLIVTNLDRDAPIEIKRGERVAQLIVVPVAALDVVERDELPPSDRGEGGLGSTGS